MRSPHEQPRPLDRVILSLLLALFLLVSPFTDWWARDTAPWYLPYLVWAVVIALGYALQRRGRP